MTDKYNKPRLRFFEESTSQRHIMDGDRYIYRRNDEARYRFVILGTGTIGQEHMRVTHMLGSATVHGIYDRSEHSMAIAAQEYAKYADNELIQYESVEAACADPDVDALLICTPNYTHIDVLETAAACGKPVLLEKPMATTIEDARRIIEIAEQHASFIQVGLQYRYKAPYVEARHEALERVVLGDIKTISMSEYRPPFLDKVDQWNKFSEFTGGTLIEKCCHYFDLMNLFAKTRPAFVYASSGQAVNFRDFERDGRVSDIDDHAFVVIDYDNGVRGNFTLNMFSPHFYEELIVCGDQGRLVASERFDFLTDDVARSSIHVELGEDGSSRTTDVGYARPIEQSGHHGATFFEHVEFVKQLDGKSTSAATPIEGLWSIIVAAAAQESADTGQRVDIANFLKQHQLTDLMDAKR
ncbi:MAG: Gfo/Idh/MocA family oxidoreductase [Pseudomonadota bacterium]